MSGKVREETVRGIEAEQEMREALFREVEEILTELGRVRLDAGKSLILRPKDEGPHAGICVCGATGSPTAMVAHAIRLRPK